MSKPRFEKAAILGVGLIGASLALALRTNALAAAITGFGRTEENLKRAKSRGIIDSYSLDPAMAVRGADIVVLATPVGMFPELAKKIRTALSGGTLVIDVGSVKGRLVYELEALMPEGTNFVGCHPIAGSDRSGIDAASGDLFKGALCILTKTENTNDTALKTASDLWQKVGADVKIMSPEEHDRVYALVSHLPHLVAYCLVNAVADAEESALQYAGQGFRDTTRVAGSSPEMWADIFTANSENLLRYLDAFKTNIEKLKELLSKGDTQAIKMELERARKIRQRLNRD